MLLLDIHLEFKFWPNIHSKQKNIHQAQRLTRQRILKDAFDPRARRMCKTDVFGTAKTRTLSVKDFQRKRVA